MPSVASEEDPLQDLIAEVDEVERLWRIEHQSLTDGKCQVPVSDLPCGLPKEQGKMTCSVHDPEAQDDPDTKALILLFLAEDGRRKADEPLPPVRAHGSPTFAMAYPAKCWMCGDDIPAGTGLAKFTGGDTSWVGHTGCVDAALRAAANRFKT